MTFSNLSQAKSSFSTRFWGTRREGRDKARTLIVDEICTNGGSLGFESTLKTWTEGSWTGRIGRLGLTTPDLDDLCLAFFSLRLLRRFPKSIYFDKLFLFSSTDGRGWDCTPCLTTLSITSYLYSNSQLPSLKEKHKMLVKKYKSNNTWEISKYT